MMRFTSLITIFLIFTASLFAQAPEKFTYQAVVRNTNNSLVINAQVGVRVNILQGSTSGVAVYSESHVASTNANGLITVSIGGGSVLHGSFAGIDWSDGPYFLKTDIDPNGGNDYTITSTQQLLSVPYALYAKEAGNSFSGDYNDLTNTPQIPTVPDNVSAFTNDAGYITAEQVPAQVNADWNATSGAAQILNKPTLFSGDYNDLTNLPQIPQIPADISAFNNDAGYLTSYTETDPQFNAWDKDYNDLINKPTIPTVPTNVSAFTNDAGYLTSFTEQQVLSISNDTLFLTGGSFVKLPAGFDGDYNSLTNTPAIPTTVGELTNDANYITIEQVPAQVNADWNATEGAAQILNKPTLFSGDYNDLTNLPQIPQIPADISAFNNDAGYLTSFTEQQVLSISNDTLFLTGGSFVKLPSGFDGDYNSLTNTPAIPTTVGELTNDANYITIEQVPAQVNADWNATEGAAQILNKPELFDGDYNSLTNKPELFSGDYNDLTNTPTIPTVPTNVSAFNNDTGYLTEYIEQQVLSISNDTLFLTGGSFVKLPSGFDGDYNSLTNKPVIPTTVGELTNNANYITMEDVPEQVNADWNATEGAAQILNKPELFDGDYNSLTNAPTIPTVPTNVSAFTNDAGYITAANVQEAANIPTNVSAFNNDAGYITSEDIPEIPTVPTNVSAFNNDAGYLTEYTEQQVLSISNDTLFLTGGSYVKLPAGFDGDYNSLTNKPVIPTTVGELTNNANYITIEDVPAQVNADWNATEGAAQILNKPTDVSAFTNDAGYITGYNETQTLADVTAQGNSAGNRQLKNVSDPTENLDAVNLRTLTSQINSLQDNFQQQMQQLQQQVSQMQQQIDSLQNIVNSLDTSNNTSSGSAVIDSKSCPAAPTVTDHEGNVYATVQIGDQCWMRDNLRTTTSPSTGTYLIPAAGTGYTYTGKQAFWYTNDSATYAPMNYGLLYNWNAAVDTFNTTYGETSVNTSSSNAVSVTFNGHRRGICPAGWHLPSDAEWTQLTDYVSSQSEYTCSGNSNNIAKALASTEGWNSYSGECYPGDQSVTANNATGFSAVPAGSCYGSSFNTAGYGAFFWSSAQGNSYGSYGRYLDYGTAPVYRNSRDKYYGRSVRCLRDETSGGGGTAATLPTVTTGSVNEVTAMSASCGGNIIADGGASVTARGVCWSTSQNPTVNGSHTADGSGMGSFSSSISGLTANTTYYVRAYATNSVGTAYGNEVSFTTLSTAVIDEKSCPAAPTVTDHEGNVYATVQIGAQCWMRENLRTTTSPKTGTYLVNTSNKSGNNASTFDGSKVAHWCMNDSATYAPKGYGLLYNWCAVMDTANPSGYIEVPTESSGNNNSFTFNPSGKHRGICPEGWHVPTDAEWSTMEAVVNGSNVSSLTGYRGFHAGKLAGGNDWDSTSTTNAPGNYSSTVRNSTGFTVVPAGYFYTSFNQTRIAAILWTSSQESEAYKAWGRYFRYENVGVGRYTNSYHGQGRSVRCLRNETGGGTVLTEPTVTTSGATDVTETSATLNGSISNPDNVAITAQGFEWKATSGGAYAAVNATGETMTYNLTGLTAGTSYTYRAFLTTAEGTSYGEEVSFTTEENSIPADDAQPCPGIPTVTDYEGNTYNTVLIGQQCWMRENLRTTKYADGTSISQGTSNSTTTAYWAYPNGNSSNKTLYGLLYNWKAVMRNSSSSSANPSGVQGICPTGWHVPSDAEWVQLKNHIMSQSQFWCGSENYKISKAMSSTTGWNTSTGTCVPGNDLSSNNATGFSALPAGNFSSSSIYNYFRSFVYIWSATEENSTKTYNWRLNKDDVEMYRRSTDKYFGFSVRCLHDSLVAIDTINAPSDTTTNPIDTSLSYNAKSCPGTPTVTDYDGNVYNTVKIGNQCWMKENLRTTSYSDGTPIEQGTDTSRTTAYWYYPSGNSGDMSTLGLLYNWAAVMRGSASSSENPSGVQGICPTGWHVPSDAEWTELTDYVSSQSEYACSGTSIYIAKALASTTGWNSFSSNCTVGNTPSDNNATGLGIVPAGYYSGNYNAATTAYCSSATEYNENYVCNRNIGFFSSTVNLGNLAKYAALSVRCIKD